ncbi:MAG TPA: glycosyltransferase, partial [Nitrospirota bacterium]|nr:glycosyltransferase [Nitrospirota bacterium]
MRILFYAPTFLPTVGGAEIMLHNLAQTLTRRGHGVTVLAPKVRGKDNLVEASYRIVRYQRPSSKRFFVRQTLFHIAREKLTRGFDLLHCHGAYPAGFVGASFKTIFRTPLVVRPHGSDILPGEHIRENPRLEKRLVRALLRADAVIAQSDELRELILALGVPAERVVQIPNGVDLSLYVGAPATPPTQGPYVLALGSLTHKKGFDVLIQAMAEVSRQDGAVRLLIAGGGTEKDGLRGLITELGLEDRVTLTGVLSGQAKLDAVKGCIFGVSSSR